MSIEQLVYKDYIDIYNYDDDSLQFCANCPHFCRSYCNANNSVLFCRKKEVNDVENGKKLLAKVAKKAAEKALRRDANSTTCFGFYQPKAPAALKRFKSSE